MPETRVLFPEWLDANGTIAYPFADTATLRNAEGMYLPESLFLDASFYPVGGRERMYLARIDIDYETVTLTVGDAGSAARCSGSFPLLAPTELIRFTDDLGRPAGVLVADAEALAFFQAWPVGSHAFKVAETEWTARCCVPTPEPGVAAVKLEDGTLASDELWLVAGPGVVFTPRTVEAADPDTGAVEIQQVIRIDIVGDPLWRRSTCGTAAEIPRPLRQLTVVSGSQSFAVTPDSRGDVKLTVASQATPDTVLRVRTAPGELWLETVGEVVSGNT